MSRKYTYRASPTGEAFHSAAPGTFLYKGVRGVPGCGKTIMCQQDIVMKSHMQPPIFDPATGKMVRWVRWGMFRDTFQALQKTTIPDWLDWHPVGPNMTMHWSPPIRGVYEIPSMREDDREKGVWVRIELEFYATGAPTFVNDIDGLSLSGAYFNEAAAQDWELIHKVQERVGRFKPPGASAQGWKGLSFGILMDTNTPVDSSWWYQLEQVEKPDRMLWFIQPPAMIRTTKPPPRGCTFKRVGDVYYVRNDEAGHAAFGTSGVCENVDNLQDGWDYYEKQLIGADEDYIKRRLLNEYGKIRAGLPVWPAYSDAIHSTDDEMPHERGTVTLVGMDFGGNPAAVFCQRTRMGQFRVLGEEAAFNKMVPPFVDEQLIPRLIRDFNWPQTPAVVFGDPAGKNVTEMSVVSAYQFLQSKGLRISPLDGLKNNDVKVRITAVDAILRQIYKGVPAFLMSRKCKTLREAMNGGYCYKKMRAADGSSRYDDKPDKDSPFSHISDALQYVVVGTTGGAGAAYSLPGGAAVGFQPSQQMDSAPVGGCMCGCV